MSHDFSNIQVLPLHAKPYARPTWLQDAQGKYSLGAPTLIYWDTTGQTILSNIGYSVAMNAGGPIATLTKILSVYIDNTNNSFPVAVNFPDTNFTIFCAPFAAEYAPVITGITIANVYALGVAQETQGQTLVIFMDRQLDGFISPEQAYVVPQFLASNTSSSISFLKPLQSYSNYFPPALGDISDTQTVDCSNLAQKAQLFGGIPQNSGTIFLTHMSATILERTATVNNLVTVQMLGFFAGLPVAFTWNFGLRGTIGLVQELGAMSAMNVRLVGTGNWVLNVSKNAAASGALFQLQYAYTVNTSAAL